MSLTLSDAQNMLTLWQEAEQAIAECAQEYRIGTRLLRRADLAEVHKMVIYYKSEVQRLSTGRRPGVRVVRIVPRDL
jgi:hypothetical protein